MSWWHPATAAAARFSSPPVVHSASGSRYSTACTNVKYEDDEDVPVMQLTAAPADPPSLSSLFDQSRSPPPHTAPANHATPLSPPSRNPRPIGLTAQPPPAALPRGLPSPSAFPSPSIPSIVHSAPQQYGWPQRPHVKVETQQHAPAVDWNKENRQQPPHHALNGHNGSTQYTSQHNHKPLQPALLPQHSSPQPPLAPQPAPSQLPLSSAPLNVLQAERPFPYCFPHSSAPSAPVVPFMPPPTADVPHTTNLSFHAVRPPAASKPPPILSKAAKRRQAAKEAAKEIAIESIHHDVTPTKRKRAEQQHSTPESSKGRKAGGRKKEEAPSVNQASLYSFFSSPHQQTDAHTAKDDTDEDEGGKEYGRSKQRKRIQDTKARKRRKENESQTLEQMEKEVRKLVFPTTDAGPRHAASKAGKKKADTATRKELEEERTGEEDFTETGSKQCALGLYTSQADYNRNVLETLRQHYQDITTGHDALQHFWDQAHDRHAVSIAAIYYNGSTSYRWPSEQQKKRFRIFNRIGRKRDAKTIDTVDIREHGVIKCVAVTFTFSLRESEAASGLNGGGLRYMMTTWRDKSEEDVNEEVRLQLSAVVLAVMKLPLEKVMFEAKDTLCVLMSSLRLVQAPACQQLVDVQVACWLLDPNVSKESERSKYQLLPLIHQHLERDSGYDTDVTDRPADIARGLLADMADVVSLWHHVRSELVLQRMNAVFQEQEMRLLPVLAEMQYLGTRFDGENFKLSNNAIISKMNAMNMQLVTIAGEPFLVTSPVEVARIMFDKMRFSRITSGEHGRTKGKNTHPPTNENVIQSLLSIERDESRRAFLNGISQYRKLNKVKTTYVTPLLEAAEEVRARPMDPPSHYAIFCSWNQTHTSTGRLSTSLPNLQSLPRGTKTVEEEEEDEEEEAAAELEQEADTDTDGRRASKTVLREINIRDCFRPQSNDSLFLSADFNQMEMRIMAHLSNDGQLVRFFNSMQGSDIYVFMASLCFDCTEVEVTKEQRACAKQLSLGILYGMGADNMAKKLTRFTGRTYSENEALRLISKWKEKFSGVARFMVKAKQDASTNYSARTLWGRVRPLPDIHHASSYQRAYAERQAVNTVIQGTAADLAKRAMIAIHEQIQQLHQQYNHTFPALARLTLQLHDEIILEVRSGLEAEVAAVVRHCMENVFVPPTGEAEARVPFPVSLKVGRTLGTLQPFELPRQEEQLGNEAVAEDGVQNEVRALIELAAVDEDEWSDFAASTPVSQRLRSSLASTVTAPLSPSVFSPSNTPTTSTTYSPQHYAPTPSSQSPKPDPSAHVYSPPNSAHRPYSS